LLPEENGQRILKKFKNSKKKFIYLISPNLINNSYFFTELEEIFKTKKISIDKEMAFTCGSGVTACVLGLANSIISGKKPVIYDGSWAEYGLN